MKPGKNVRKLPQPTTFADEVVNSFSDFFERVDRGEQMTLRTVALDLRPQEFGAEDIRRIRTSLKTSQAVFAKLLGISTLTVQSWEQGTRKPSSMANRFLDEIAKSPQYWKGRLAQAVVMR
jgi:DNA-binding transcriptional regulator YiaG